MTYRLLIDTSVWLDLAKDYRQQALLTALEAICNDGSISLLLPQVVVEEFGRHKSRIAEEAARSHSSLFKRVKDAVAQFGDDASKLSLIQKLSEIDHRIGTLGESANASIERIERLFQSSEVIPISDGVKLRAADRAINGQAPFHRQRNGISDAILIETYTDAVTAENDDEVRFAFVSHNTKDFSAAGADNRDPHPDIAACFASSRSTYSISLAEILDKAAPGYLEDFRADFEWSLDPRRLSEIQEATGLLLDQVWYNRHWNLRVGVEEGTIKIVDKEIFPVVDHATRPVQRDMWEGALRAAERVEQRRGLDNLGPWTDFEWGMINGKLSALRWVLGDEWDMLDT